MYSGLYFFESSLIFCFTSSLIKLIGLHFILLTRAILHTTVGPTPYFLAIYTCFFVFSFNSDIIESTNSISFKCLCITH